MTSILTPSPNNQVCQVSSRRGRHVKTAPMQNMVYKAGSPQEMHVKFTLGKP